MAARQHIGLEPGERISNWTADGSGFFTYQLEKGKPFPIRVFRLDVKTGSRKLEIEISPNDQAGLDTGGVRITPDGTAYAYGMNQSLAVLHVIEGLK